MRKPLKIDQVPTRFLATFFNFFEFSQRILRKHLFLFPDNEIHQEISKNTDFTRVFVKPCFTNPESFAHELT